MGMQFLVSKSIDIFLSETETKKSAATSLNSIISDEVNQTEKSSLPAVNPHCELRPACMRTEKELLYLQL